MGKLRPEPEVHKVAVEKPSASKPNSTHDDKSEPSLECPDDAPIERGFFYNVPDGTGRLHFDDVKTPRDCCAHCHQVDKCKAWSWVIKEKVKRCWLWGVTPTTKVQRDDCASGFPRP